ncbi:TPA: PTS cellobiose/arbutin/salicin transporter subunit IIBC [Klebsiella pneumoniae]|nr:PTS cellobiose/arbutin/salicin transporter subunit IIBC [Klebsiella pneumoniae]
MSKNYAALAQQIVAAIGGVDNVAAVTHCMTRLRFVVKDDEQVDSSTLKGLAGVLGVVRSDNQCQVIIGNTVSQAYREVVNLLPGDLRPAEPQGKAPLTLKRIGAGILDALIGTMSPLIPAIIGGSMVKLLAMILEMSGALPKGSPTLTLLALIGDGAFFFLPLMVAASAAVTKNFLKPMLIVLIAAPLAILLIGPLGIWIGSAISALVYTIHSYLGWLSVAIMGGLWPLLVMTGMHRVFTPTIIQTIAETGKEGMVMPSEIGANLSLGGSSLAVAWKTKNPELRQTALAAAASAILAGISEPALYGVAVRLKRPLIASLISGFICGAVAGIAGLASHSMAAPGLFTSVQFFDPANPMTIVWVFGVMALSVVLSFALTLILGFEDIPVEQAAADARARQARAQASHA